VENRKKGLIMVTVAPMLWGCSGIFVSHLFDHGVDAVWLVNIRLVIAGLLLLLYSVTKRANRTFAIWQDKTSIPRLLTFSIIGMLGIQLTYFMTISYSDPATATILQFTNAVMLSVVLAVKLKKLPRRVELISLMMAIIGVLFLVTNGHFTQLTISVPGLVWGILSAVAAVLYTLMPVKLVKQYGAIPITGWAMFLSGVLFNFYQPCWQHVPQLTLPMLGSMAFIILLGTIIPYVLFLQGVQYVRATTASMLGAMEPLSAAALTFLVMGEQLSVAKFIGIVLVLLTVFIQALDKPKIASRSHLSGNHSKKFQQNHFGYKKSKKKMES
jgi:drug/metabolite transporter (DMT)-like permease